MKGMQKRRVIPGAVGKPVENTGFDVEPTQLLFASAAFVIGVLLLHFFGKMFGSSSA